MPRVSSADAATLSAWDLVEALKHTMPKVHFATINDTHHTALRNLVELFNVIPKIEEKKSTNRHNGRRRQVEK